MFWATATKGPAKVLKARCGLRTISLLFVLFGCGCAAELQYIERGDKLMRQEKFPGAVEAYQKARGLNPESVEAALGLGYALLGQKRFFDAAKVFEESRGLMEEVDPLLGLADVAAQQGDTSTAVDYIEQALAGHPEDVRLHRLLGGYALEAGEFDRALEAFERAKTHDANSSLASLEVARALLKLKRYQDGISEVDAALELAKSREQPPEALYRLRGEIFEAMRQPDRALASYDSALKNGPNHLGTVLARARLLGELDRLDEAIEFLQLHLRQESDSAGLHLQLARSLVQYRMLEQAATSYDRAYRLDSTLPRLEYIEVLKELGRPKQLAKVLKKASEAEPGNVDVHIRAGQMAFKGKKWAAAESFFRRAVTARALDEEANYMLGLTLLELGKQGEAGEVHALLLRMRAKRADPLGKALERAAEQGKSKGVDSGKSSPKSKSKSKSKRGKRKRGGKRKKRR